MQKILKYEYVVDMFCHEAANAVVAIVSAAFYLSASNKKSEKIEKEIETHAEDLKK